MGLEPMMKFVLAFALLASAIWLVLNEYAIAGAALAFVVLILILLDHRS
jgi:hypothetical protein